jgi:hypothetical protein
VIALYALWCGVCWVLRGGKFGAIYRALFAREPGTTVTRIGCAILMAAPLAFVDPAYALLAASIYAAMTLGYFDESMGLEQPGRDHAFLALWGVAVSFVMLLPLAYLVSLWALAWASLGALAMPAYAINKTLGRRFGMDWTERAEFLTGCAMGAALYGGVVL